MSRDEEHEFMWLITHDPSMRHVNLEIHTTARLSPREFLEHLYELLEQYEEKPQEMFDNAQIVEPQ